MTLQELIGELQTLAVAYPDTTLVRVQWRDLNVSDVVGVSSESSSDELFIVIEAQ